MIGKSIEGVKAVLAKCESEAERRKVLNHAPVYHEVQDKGFYDKEWDWFDDNALQAACRKGDVELVRFLLSTGEADPWLESCPRVDDKYET